MITPEIAPGAEDFVIKDSVSPIIRFPEIVNVPKTIIEFENLLVNIFKK